jgi:hypothetical protein
VFIAKARKVRIEKFLKGCKAIEGFICGDVFGCKFDWDNDVMMRSFNDWKLM